jgi:hypothetical protein
MNDKDKKALLNSFYGNNPRKHCLVLKCYYFALEALGEKTRFNINKIKDFKRKNSNKKFESVSKRIINALDSVRNLGGDYHLKTSYFENKKCPLSILITRDHESPAKGIKTSQYFNIIVKVGENYIINADCKYFDILKKELIEEFKK